MDVNRYVVHALGEHLPYTLYIGINMLQRPWTPPRRRGAKSKQMFQKFFASFFEKYLENKKTQFTFAAALNERACLEQMKGS